MAEPRGNIFNISRGCFDDGPGLRTVVFFKGCRLSCPWCHNAEGLAFEPQVLFDASLCIECGACRGGRRIGVEPCPTGARRLVGHDIGVGELLEQIERDTDFIVGTGGGVTFSGGEPMCQPSFLFACSEAARARGLHVTVETAGYWDEELASSLAGAVDLILFDIKHVDFDKLQAATGRDGRAIVRNLAALLESGVELELRFTPVPGFSDGSHDREAIESWLSNHGWEEPLRIVPFHRMGESKADRLEARPYRSPDRRWF